MLTEVKIRLSALCYSKFKVRNILVVGIIDRDDKTDKKEETLAKDNIFMLKEREIESIFLRQDVIEKLFGDTVFMQFSQEICKDATNRSNNTVANYQEALSILKKKLSSEYNIRMLLKTAKIKNKGNKENIEFLSSMMEEKGVWKIIEDVIPKLPNIEQKDTFKAREKFQKKLQNFTPIKTEANSIDEGDEHEKRPEENKDIFKGC